MSDAIDELLNLRSKPLLREAGRVRPTRFARDPFIECLELVQSFGNCSRILSVKEQPRRPSRIGGQNDIGRATSTVSDYRGTAGLCLNHGNPKILLCRKHVGTGPLHEIEQLGRGDCASEFDVPRSPSGVPDPSPFRAIPYHDESAMGMPSKAFDDDLCTLVGHETAG